MRINELVNIGPTGGGSPLYPLQILIPTALLVIEFIWWYPLVHQDDAVIIQVVLPLPLPRQILIGARQEPVS